jgi:hypothetical protein
MYFQNVTSSSCDKLLMGPNGGYTPSSKSIVQPYDQFFGNVSAFFFSNTSL